MKRLVIDLDHTLTRGTPSNNYADAVPNEEVVARVREYHEAGFEIVVFTSRNMRTFENNTGKIMAHTAPVILEWLQKHAIPYDELWVGKPWCGYEGFYVDDRAIRPNEFVSLSQSEIAEMLGFGHS